MKVEGECHCGQIAYEAEVDSSGARICHCTDCQTLTGSAFRVNVMARAETFKLSRGEVKIYLKTADSGNKRAHAFCPNCGTPIYAAAPTDPETYSLRVGTLKERRLIARPKQQIYCRSALPWIGEIDAIDKCDHAP